MITIATIAQSITGSSGEVSGFGQFLAAFWLDLALRHFFLLVIE